LKMPDWMMRMSPEERAAWDAAYEPRNESFRALELTGKELIRWKYQRYAKDYLRCIASVDDSVGRILDSIEALGLAEDTIVIYTSDQGWYLGEHGWYDKRWMYEESFRTPFVLRWPGVVKAGRRTNLLSQNIDLAPTFLDVIGADAERDARVRSRVRRILWRRLVGRRGSELQLGRPAADVLWRARRAVSALGAAAVGGAPGGGVARARSACA